MWSGNREDRWALVLAVASVALLSMFAPAAFRVDEPNILAIAKQIAREPLDPYGFTINWNGTAEPAFESLANPPLVPAFLALWASVGGWSESSIHLALLPFAFATLIALGSLGKSLRVSPSLTVAIVATSPAFFLAAQVCMPDIVMLALVSVALASTAKYLEQPRWGIALLAFLAAFAAPLAKYNAMALAPALLLAVPVSRGRRTFLISTALAPLAGIALWSWISLLTYGEPHIVAVARLQQGTAVAPWPGVLSALGLGILPFCLIPGLIATFRHRWAVAGFAVVTVLGALQAGFLLEYPIDASVLYGVAVAAGIAGILLVVGEGVRGWRERLPVAVILGGLFVATLALQNGALFTSVRYLLPLLPAALLLPLCAARDRPGRALIFAAAAFAVLLSVGDALIANSYRSWIRSSKGRIDRANTFYYAGHWGFQYYAGQAGGIGIDRRSPPALRPGDLVAIARNPFPGVDPRSFAGPAIDRADSDIEVSWPLRTIDCESAANFYGNAISGCSHFPVYLPFGWGNGRYDRVTLLAQR